MRETRRRLRRGRLRLSVTTLAATLVVVVTTALLGTLGAIHFLSNQRFERGLLRAGVATDAAELSAALALPLWNFDRAQIDKVIESQMTKRDVYAVVVRQADVSAPGGVALHARVRDDGWGVTAVDHVPAAEGMLTEDREVTAGGDTLGSVRVYVTPRFLMADARKNLIDLVVVTVILDALLSASLYYLLWWTVLRPLTAIEQYAARVAHEGPASSPPPPREWVCRELDSLGRSIERMVRLLRARLSALRTNQNMLSLILDSVPHCIFWKDAKGVYLGGNEALARTAGVRSLEEVIGKTDFELGWPCQAAEGYRSDDIEVIETRRPKRHILERVQHADGTSRWVETTKVPLLDAEGRVYGVLGVAEDITERKETEDAFRREKALTEAIFDSVPGVIYVYDDRFRLIRWNRNASDSSGFSPGELAGRVAGTGRPDGERTALHDAMRRVIRDGHATTEGHLVTKSGEFVPYLFTGVRLMIDGRPHIVGIGLDITERKRAEETLRREKALTDAVLNSVPGILVLHDGKGRVIRWNARMEEISGYSSEEIAERNVLDWPPTPADRAAAVEAMRKVLAEGHVEVEAALGTKSGRQIPFYFTAVRLVLDGTPHVLAIGMDITERKRAEEDLRRALGEAEAANRAKDNFLAAASHELRTPLMPVLLLASALEVDPQIPASAREDLGVIREHIEMEKRLIGDLLDFTAIHAGKLHMSAVPTDVHEVLRAAVRTCEKDVERKGQRLDVRLEAKAPYTTGDPDRLRQVFWNLLQNAVKFTPDGGVITVRTADDGSQWLRVEVTDTGMGMEPETLQKLFRPFEQGPRKTFQHYGGLGLGLAISKTLVEAHGGSVSATSAGREQGSTFIVRLPMTAAAAPPHPASSRLPPVLRPHLRLLLVEDHLLTLKTLTRLLEAEGHTVTTATTIAGALKAAGGARFDVVLSDIGLPDGSGCDLMPILKERYGLNGIALSGFGADGDLDASRRAGFMAHLTKPVTIEALREAIARFDERGQAASAVPKQSG